MTDSDENTAGEQEQWHVDGMNVKDEAGSIICTRPGYTDLDVAIRERIIAEHNDRLASRAALAALEKIAEPKLRLSRGKSATCLRCGMQTYFEKDSEAQHEKDCVQQFARQALDDLREGNHGRR